VPNQNIGADIYVIYAGAHAMTGDTAGIGGPGGWVRPEPTVTGTNNFTATDLTNIENITTNFTNAIRTRGESSGFAAWGGKISFDTSSRNWHTNHTTPPAAGTTDLYSVAIHEMAHALGFGQDDTDAGNVTPWEFHVGGAFFNGSNAQSAYGGAVPLNPGTMANPDYSHWASGTNSVVYGGSTAQETAMDPELTQATYKNFTALDAAAMKDIGWTVVAPAAPPPPRGIFGDYNNNGIVDAADFVVWRKTDGTQTGYNTWRTNFGKTAGSGAGGAAGAVPEPASAVLMVIGVAVTFLARRERRG
jgi:hypothetical protein